MTCLRAKTFEDNWCPFHGLLSTFAQTKIPTRMDCKNLNSRALEGLCSNYPQFQKYLKQYSQQKRLHKRSLNFKKNGAVGRSRTGTWLPTQDFESSTSTNFITTAKLLLNFQFLCDEIGSFNWNFLRSATVSSSQRHVLFYQNNFKFPVPIYKKNKSNL